MIEKYKIKAWVIKEDTTTAYPSKYLYECNGYRNFGKTFSILGAKIFTNEEEVIRLLGFLNAVRSIYLYSSVEIEISYPENLVYHHI